MPKYPRFSKRTDAFTAHRHAVRAFKRGDVVAAVRWYLAACHRVENARSENDFINHHPIPRPKYKPKPLPPAMPVMLDPKGFSPGGEPNWYLNQRRLERAGLKKFPDPPRKDRWARYRQYKEELRQKRLGTSQCRTP